MTLRSASRRIDRSRHGSRRTLYTNLAFGAILVIALVILAVAAGVSYYSDHLAPVATVNGHSISKDDLRARIAIDTWRINSLESQLRNAVSSGRLSKATSDQQIASLEKVKTNTNTFVAQSLQNLIDNELMNELASQKAITVTAAQIDARLALEATTAEARHIWILQVKPQVTAPATTPTPLQLTTAQTTINAAEAALKTGTTWETVAKQVTPSDTTAGDQGFAEKDGSLIDPALLNALFALPANGFTGVIKGADGTFRIGRVTQIIPQSIDPNYQQSITAAGISLDTYRAAVEGDLVRTALSDRIVADATTKPSLQRHVLEIMMTQQIDQTTKAPILTDQVDAAHILYAPYNASGNGSPVPSGDPGWEVAHQRALATYYALLKDPTQFAAIAKRDSADTGSAANGGDLGYLSQSGLVKPFGDAIFKPGLVKGEILPPVQTQFGWHVIEFLGRRPPALTAMNGLALQLAKPGADFAALAKANSTAANASTGGDMGWVAPYQLSQKLEDAITATAVGKVSAVVTDGNNVYLYKVVDEQTRLPDASQIATLKSSAFQNWYNAQRAKATITTDPAFTVSSSGSSIPGG